MFCLEDPSNDANPPLVFCVVSPYTDVPSPSATNPAVLSVTIKSCDRTIECIVPMSPMRSGGATVKQSAVTQYFDELWISDGL